MGEGSGERNIVQHFIRKQPVLPYTIREEAGFTKKLTLRVIRRNICGRILKETKAVVVSKTDDKVKTTVFSTAFGTL